MNKINFTRKELVESLDTGLLNINTDDGKSNDIHIDKEEIMDVLLRTGGTEIDMSVLIKYNVISKTTVKAFKYIYDVDILEFDYSETDIISFEEFLHMLYYAPFFVNRKRLYEVYKNGEHPFKDEYLKELLLKDPSNNFEFNVRDIASDYEIVCNNCNYLKKPTSKEIVTNSIEMICPHCGENSFVEFNKQESVDCDDLEIEIIE